MSVNAGTACASRAREADPRATPAPFLIRSAGDRHEAPNKTVAMNYYQHFLGDYAKRTSDLSLIEHGAYRLMIDFYYSEESPPPADLDKLYRICRAMTKAEQQAVKSVADRFFPLQEDGTRRNNRCEEEIERYHQSAETARQNGRKGGRPRKGGGNA